MFRMTFRTGDVIEAAIWWAGATYALGLINEANG